MALAEIFGMSSAGMPASARRTGAPALRKKSSKAAMVSAAPLTPNTAAPNFSSRAVRDIVDGAEGMLDGVVDEGRPAIAAGGQAVEGQRGGPHHGGAGVVVGRVFEDAQRGGDYRAGQRVHYLVGNFGVGVPGGEIALDDVRYGVDRAVGHLLARQRQRGLGVQRRDLREEGRAVGRIFLGGSLVGDHAAGVHLRAGGGQRERREERQSLADLGLAAEKVPDVALVHRPGGYGLGLVYNGAAPRRHYQVAAGRAGLRYAGLHVRERRVRLYAGMLRHRHAVPGEGFHYDVVDAVLIDAAAAVDEQRLLAGLRGLGPELGHHGLAEDYPRGIYESEVLHRVSFTAV